ncbi:MAG: hypothetical protein AABX02_03980, partial [archaeon]
VQIKTPSLLEIDACPTNVGQGLYGNQYNQLYGGGTPYYNPSYSVLNKTTNASGNSLVPSLLSGFGVAQNTQYYTPAYGATGYDGYGNYNANAQAYNGLTGYGQTYTPLANQYYNNANLLGGLGAQGGLYGGFGGQYGCSFTQLTVVNACKSEVEITLDVDPNLQATATSFALKPNENQIVRIGSGYRIGKYAVGVNAHTKGSTDAPKTVGLVSVLVKSPTEVNADCISLDKDKYRFNDFVQKPVKAKVYNKCYDVGVRLVESADTVTLASYFNADGQLSLDGTNGAVPRNNTMAQDIQIVGLETKGDGDKTTQVLEFQIFPDLTIFKENPALLDGTGGIGERFLDYKLFAEVNYYRIESYGTISVKYLDPYGGSQQKAFPVIFENLFRAAEALDELLQGGNAAITKFQSCINVDALVLPPFGDEDFQGGTTITYTTKDPGSVMLTGREFCGDADRIGEITSPDVMKGRENNLVQATFRKVGKHDVEVTIVRPLNVKEDVTIEGKLSTTITRVFTNPGTQNVTIPVSFKVLHGKGGSPNAFSLPQACVDQQSGKNSSSYFKGSGFISTYGFDQLEWDWTWNQAPNCGVGDDSPAFCDGTQLMIYASKRVERLNQFVEANKGLFSKNQTKGELFTTENFIANILQTVEIETWNPAKAITPPAQGEKQTYYLGKDGKVLPTNDAAAITQAETLFRKDIVLPEPVEYPTYLSEFTGRMKTFRESNEEVYKNTMIFLSASKLLNEDAYTVEEIAKLSVINATDTANPFLTNLDECVYWDGTEWRSTTAKEKCGGVALKNMKMSVWMSLMRAQKLSTSNYYVWTLEEFDQFHQALYAAIISNKDANTVGIGFAGTAKDTVFITPTTLQKLYQSIDSAYVGLPAGLTPKLKVDLLKNETLRKYLLEKAKTDGDFVWTPYGSPETFVTEVLDTPIKLMSSVYNSTLTTAFEKQEGGSYNYTTELKEAKIKPEIMSGTTFKNATDQPVTTVTPGHYTLQIIGSWGNTPGEPTSIESGISNLVIRITNKNGAQLDTIKKEYAENPFFYTPFYGPLVGVGEFSIDAEGKIKGKTQSVLKNTIEGIAEVSKEFDNKAVLFSLNTATKKINQSPHIPIGLKLTFGGAVAQPGFQYYVSNKA